MNDTSTYLNQSRSFSSKHPYPVEAHSRLHAQETHFLPITALFYSLSCVLLLNACGSSSSSTTPALDPTAEAWYRETTQELVQLSEQARRFFDAGQFDQASDAIEKGQPIIKRLSSVPRPTLAAMDAASDLDDLYGRMLLRNHHYGWARLLFQKNQARWKNWRPLTPETAQRLKRAEKGIAECDRHLAQ